MAEKELDGRKQRRFRNRLLNPRFQLKYTAMIVGVASLISIVLGVYLTSMLRENSRMLKLEAEFDDVLQSQLADADSKVQIAAAKQLATTSLSVTGSFSSTITFSPFFNMPST